MRLIEDLTPLELAHWQQAALLCKPLVQRADEAARQAQEQRDLVARLTAEANDHKRRALEAILGNRGEVPPASGSTARLVTRDGSHLEVEPAQS